MVDRTDDARGHRDLDPEDWEAFRALLRENADRVVDRLRDVRTRPAWSETPARDIDAIHQPPPRVGRDLSEVVSLFEQSVAPYPINNTHPRFFGWVHGGGTAGGILAEMLGAGLNANLGGRWQSPVVVERAVLQWWRNILGFPQQAWGSFASGSSMANLMALTAARVAKAPVDIRREGIAALPAPMVLYASDQTHGCVTKAVEVLGLGRAALRPIATDADGRMVADALRAAIARDKGQGLLPFCVVATCGTVNTGAIDPLSEIAEVAAAEGLWMHVDAAFGAMVLLSEARAPLAKGIERADSVAFDFHKWMSVQYDAACLMVRDGAHLTQAFSLDQEYLACLDGGASSGAPWACESSLELSRGFRGLKVWFSMLEHGIDHLGAQIDHNISLAERLRDTIDADPELELACRGDLNVTCFHVKADLPPDLVDRLNRDIVRDIQISGVATPSHTVFQGRTHIRMAIVNHRTRWEDVAETLRAIKETGAKLRAGF